MSDTPPPLSPSAVAPLSQLLRHATQARHESVERAGSINRLIVVRVPPPESSDPAGENDTRETARAQYREVYRRFLVAAHGFEHAVQERLGGSAALVLARQHGYAAEDEESTALLARDLERAFGAGSARVLPGMPGVPPADSLGAFAGIEYVRRGSRAGGAVIGAVVAHNLGFTREHGASFLLRHGKDTRRVLIEFKAWLDALPLGEGERANAVAAADATFLAVERWHQHLDAEAARPPA